MTRLKPFSQARSRPRAILQISAERLSSLLRFIMNPAFQPPFESLMMPPHPAVEPPFRLAPSTLHLTQLASGGCHATRISFRMWFVNFRTSALSSNSFAATIIPQYRDHDNDKEKNDTYADQLVVRNGLAQDVETILDILYTPGCGESEIKDKLEHCRIIASSELVVEILSRVRNDWEAAFTIFLWAGKQPGYAHSIREYHSMISILGKKRKFAIAWALIEEMRGGNSGPSLVTPRTLLIMIRRYCEVHDIGRAINTFHAYERFYFQVGLDEFHSLLSALCEFKNVLDAEHLLFRYKSAFPFNTKSFNIILDGWCNVIVSTSHAERIWQEMRRRGIQYDVVSYTCIISCYSKASNLSKVFKLFDEMKKMKITPKRKVYNAVIRALAKGRLVKEAVNLMRTMEEDNIAPNVATYNSLIKALCEARLTEEAKVILDQMLEQRLFPTIQTYHALFRTLRSKEEVYELWNKMKELGCHPTIETCIMLIRRFCQWRQLYIVFKIWSEMSESGFSPDHSSYTALIHGLFQNGKLKDAYKYYLEMQEKGFRPDPRTEKMLQGWQVSQDLMTTLSHKFDEEKYFFRQLGTRRVTRD